MTRSKSHRLRPPYPRPVGPLVLSSFYSTMVEPRLYSIRGKGMGRLTGNSRLPNVTEQHRTGKEDEGNRGQIRAASVPEAV